MTEHAIADAEGDAEQTSNPYLEMRQAKIERNKERLKRLGLYGAAKSEEKAITDQATNVAGGSNNSGKVGSPGSRKRAKVDDSVAIRRSSRRLRTGNQATTTPINTSTNKNTLKGDKKDDKIETSKVSGKKKVATSSDPKPGTTRATPINIKKVLYGHFNYPVIIGRQLSSTGKAAVVNHALFMCQLSPIISFNKYSGVCEWSDDALFLWVNIGAPDADVENEFLDGGKEMTWYAGSRMTEESPSVQKLISVGGRAARGELEDKDGIVLWCRCYLKEKRAFSPYICLGRLAIESHDPESHPLKFVWKLIDYDILLGAQHNDGDTLFEQIMRIAKR